MHTLETLLARSLAPLAILVVLGARAPLHPQVETPVAGEAAPAWQRVERRLAVMGTWLRISLEAPTRAGGLQTSERVVRALEVAEARLSTWRTDSELAQLGATPVGERTALSPLLRRELEACWLLQAETQGAFDPALAPLVRAWSLRSGGARPTQQQLDEARAASGIACWSLDEDGLQRLHGSAGLEEGAFGKGAGLDAALAAIESDDWRALSIDLGGQLLESRHAQSITRRIADPRDRDRAVLALRIDAGSLATTGDSERGLVIDGKKYSHVLDPRTGVPAPRRGSVTVWARDALTADCLSTACFVMDPAAALAFADAHEGIEVVLLQHGAHGIEAHASAGLAGLLEPLVPELTLTVRKRTGTDSDATNAPPTPPSPIGDSNES